MPREARQNSDTGVYHVILRGVNKQQIFECSEDYERFLAILETQARGEENPFGERQGNRCAIYAYCLMGNHVHLLVKQITEPIGDTIKRISSAYVYYYNHKYDRIGHLFQERFKSQPVSDWQYFLTLLRYIHQNPLKPHLVRDLAHYPWSSWPEYLSASTRPFCRTAVVLSRIPLADLRSLVDMPLTESETIGLLDIDDTPHKTYYTDEEIWQLITQESGATNSTQWNLH